MNFTGKIKVIAENEEDLRDHQVKKPAWKDGFSIMAGTKRLELAIFAVTVEPGEANLLK